MRPRRARGSVDVVNFEAGALFGVGLTLILLFVFMDMFGEEEDE